MQGVFLPGRGERKDRPLLGACFNDHPAALDGDPVPLRGKCPILKDLQKGLPLPRRHRLDAGGMKSLGKGPDGLIGKCRGIEKHPGQCKARPGFLIQTKACWDHGFSPSYRAAVFPSFASVKERRSRENMPVP